MKIPIYRYSGKTLEYVKIDVNLKKVLIFLSIQSVISLTLLTIFSLFFNTPKEKRLMRELNGIKYEFTIIDRKCDELILLFNILERKDSIIYQSLFTVDNPKNKFIEDGYISQHYDGSFTDTINSVGDKLSRVEMLLERANYRFKNLIIQLSSSNTKLSHMPAIQPISNKTLERTSSGFGMRIHPIYKIRKMHEGMDFVAPVGTPIYATADGIVSIGSESYFGNGKYVKINHSYGYETSYSHLSQIMVKKGQPVKRGDIIGLLGNTGLSTGPHLHYEVIQNNKPVNPINYYFHDLNGTQYEEMIRIANTFDKSMD